MFSIRPSAKIRCFCQKLLLLHRPKKILQCCFFFKYRSLDVTSKSVYQVFIFYFKPQPDELMLRPRRGSGVDTCNNFHRTHYTIPILFELQFRNGDMVLWFSNEQNIIVVMTPMSIKIQYRRFVFVVRFFMNII